MRRSQKGLVLVSAVLTQLMIVLDVTVVAVALPSMQTELGMTAEQRPWVITAYSLAFGGLVLFGGRLSGVLGVRAAYWTGLTGFAASSLIAGLAPSFAVLAGARTGQGVFAAVLAPTILVLVNRTFTETVERSKAFAALGATGGLGAAVGLLVGGSLTEALDWRWTMYVNVPIALIAVLVSVTSVPATVQRIRPRRLLDDLLGILLGCTAIFSLIYGFDRAQQDGWGAASTRTWLTLAAALAVAFVLRERFARTPVLPLGMLRHSSRASSYAVMLLSTCAQMGCIVYLTFYFQEHLDYSPLGTGVVFLPMVATLAVTAGLAGRLLVPRYGAKLCFPAGLAVQALGLFLFARLTVDATYAEAALPGLLVFGVGLGLALPVVFNAGTRGVPPKQAGLASAVISTSQQIGASFGVALLSTYATRRVQDDLDEHRTGVERDALDQLTQAGVRPDSTEGQRLIDRLIASAVEQAQIDAYSGGFILLGTIVATAAVILTAATAWRSVRRRHAKTLTTART